MKLHFKFLVLLCLLTDCVHCFLSLDPFTKAFTLTFVAGFGCDLLYRLLYDGKEKQRRLEQCTKSWVKSDLEALAQSLEQNLHGQHLVPGMIIGALTRHLNNPKPQKALVMSFHGWTGSGKNYVSKLIAESLFKLGLNSQFVRVFNSTLDFPDETEESINRLNLKKGITDPAEFCHQSLFIFDEMDKLQPGFIDTLKPYIDITGKINGIDYRRSIFIFLSKTGGKEINKFTLERLNNGKKREDILLKDVKPLIKKGIYNKKGGLHESKIMTNDLVDYYVPFLPLERKHVELCARDELKSRGFRATDHLIKRVADETKYYPSDTELFSSTGCKHVSEKATLVIYE